MNKAVNQITYLERVKTRTEAGIYVSKHGLHAIHAHLYLCGKSNSIPYHNIDHILAVTKHCGRLAGMHRVPIESEKALIAAAMFHDIHHSGGTLPDTTNVSVAINAMRAFFLLHPSVLTPDEQELAVKCVECTVYPFTVEPELEIQKIIRDADILYSFEAGFEEILLGGLRSEVSVTRKRKITKKEFALGEIEFLNGITMHTVAGNLLFQAALPVITQRLGEVAAKP